MTCRSKSERRISHAALKIFFEIYAAEFYIWFLIKLKTQSLKIFALYSIKIKSSYRVVPQLGNSFIPVKRSNQAFFPGLVNLYIFPGYNLKVLQCLAGDYQVGTWKKYQVGLIYMYRLVPNQWIVQKPPEIGHRNPITAIFSKVSFVQVEFNDQT